MSNDEGTPGWPLPEEPEGGDGEEAEKPDESRPEPSKEPDFPGSELLRGGSTREILHRICEGDPLGVMERCELRVKERAVLIDTVRLYHGAIARVAYEAHTYQGQIPFLEWVDRCIDTAIRTLVTRDSEEERQGIPPREPLDVHYIALSAVLGIEPPLCRRAALVFHTLPLETRRAFYAVAVEGKTMNRLVAEGHGPPEKAEARIEYAFTMMSTLGKFGIGGPDGGGPGEESLYDDD